MSADDKENSPDTNALRLELKSWENAFQQENGRKPGRADIKNDATIAAKYKLYDKVTRREQTAPNRTPKKSTRPRQRETIDEDTRPHRTSATPRKSPQKNETQSLPPSQPSPFDEIEATPAHIKCALGPTPLKDGQMLGIFDFLSATPSRDHDKQKPGIETLVAGTPSKAAPASSDHAFSETPQSASKRRFLDAFAGTPLKRKREEDDAGGTNSSKKQFPTPAFLRRSFPMASIDEEGEGHSIARPPFRRRGLVRSLSSIIQGLKKQEDERMDDEWDIMREIEEEEEENEGQGAKDQKKKEGPKVLVEDSQAPEMPLGPDQAPVSEYEDTDEEAKNAGRKPWKKKGLKRQTKRTKMKPVVHKAKKADEVTEFDEEEPEIVPETQMAEGAQQGSEGDDNSGSDEDEGKKKGKKTTAKEKEKAGKESSKKPRKVNPDAHANFRRLNIKNKNSKANGRGKRFGRR